MIDTKGNKVEEELLCYHCGDGCRDDIISADDKIFCCNGCKTVYEILNESNLCDYYSYDETPGISQKKNIKRNYSYLDEESVIDKFLDFNDGKISTLKFTIPQMHCASCIWILENLNELDPGIIASQVNFVQKKLALSFRNDSTSLKNIVELLDSIGYEPALSLETEPNEAVKLLNRKLYYKIGVAGFAFGNIMLLSFPDYLSIGGVQSEFLRSVFGYLSLALALPVVFFSSSEYYISALKGLRKRIVNIDVPITLGIFVLFARSAYEIAAASGTGYFDSLSGLVFFLLIGKVFQNKTYDSLNFERNYKSYFPIAVNIQKDGKESAAPIENLTVGDRISIKNNELIPADSVLISDSASIDYSFVTGESTPVHLDNGALVYAGGRQIGGTINAEVIKNVDQSYLTQLWNSKIFGKGKGSNIVSAANTVSKYFTFIVLFIAFSAAAFWLTVDSAAAVNVFIAVLIVACPCALALSTPFTLGNTQRIFGRNKFYLKNPAVVEELASVKTIVFDKTGTITYPGKTSVSYSGDILSPEEKKIIFSAVRNSSHPLSRSISEFLNCTEYFNIQNYTESPGLGISAAVNGKRVKIGSAEFTKSDTEKAGGTKSVVAIDGQIKGAFQFKNHYREGLSELTDILGERYSLNLISGDNESERGNLSKIFPADSVMKFNSSPHDKLEHIAFLQKEGEKVLMIGDGLNDAGALNKSDVGISIAEVVNNFSPACDAILSSDNFSLLPEFLRFSHLSRRIILISFVISFLYNAAGLFFAVQGLLSPIIAAILMPVSSISVVLFTTAATGIAAKKRGLI